MSIFRRIFDGIHASREGSSAIKMFIKIREGFILNKVMSLHDAVAKYVENGDTLAIGGFTTNRKPYATVSEILRQGQKDFIVYAGPGGGEVDMLIGEGRVAAYINCYTANSGYTNVSRRFRAAIEQGKLTYEDYSQDVLMLMLHASSLGLPFLPVRLMQGSGLMKFWGISEEKRKTMPKMEDLKCVEIENPMVPGQKVVAVPVPRIENLKCAEIENPMVPGQKVVAVPVPKIDTAIIHVQQASPDGTCIIMGDEFHDIDIAIAARKTIVTCEEIVSDEFIRRDPTKTRIFGECVQAVVKAPYGAWPAQCYDYYDDDDAGLKEYDKASKYQDAEDAVKQLEKAAAKAAKALEKAPEDEKLKLAAENAQKAFELAKSGEKIPETFKDFLEKWVYSCEDQSALLDKLGGSRLMRLKNEPHLGYSTTH